MSYFVWAIIIAVVLLIMYFLFSVSEENKKIFLQQLSIDINENELEEETKCFFCSPWFLAFSIKNKKILLAKRDGCDVIEKHLFSYADIQYCSMDEDGKSVSSGTLTGALLGGVAFGAIGAVVGSVAGKKINQKTISMSVVIGLKDGTMISVEKNDKQGLNKATKDSMRWLYHFISSKVAM